MTNRPAVLILDYESTTELRDGDVLTIVSTHDGIRASIVSRAPDAGKAASTLGAQVSEVIAAADLFGGRNG